MGKKDKKKHQDKEEVMDEKKPQTAEKEEEAVQEEEVTTEKKAILQPKKVQYCPICTLPFQLCKYGKKVKECKKFLMEIAPTKVQKYHPNSGVADNQEGQDKAQEEEEKPEKKTKENKKQKSLKEKYIVIDVKQRTKKKFTTTITGLQIFKIDSKDLTKKLSKKFACSCSAQDSGSAVIQGDFYDDARQFLITEYGVKKKYILDGEQFKAKQAEEKEKKKQDKAMQQNEIKQEPEEKQQEKKEEQGQKKPEYKTEFQRALAEMDQDQDDDE